MIVYASSPVDLEIVDLKQVKQDAIDGALDYLYRNTTPEKEVETAEKHLTHITTGMMVI